MKKRILLINKFYYRRGGDCVYVLNLESLLKSRGHDVAVYAMDYPENLPSEWSRYFPEEVDFGKDKVKGIERIFGYGDIKTSFARILEDFRPDVVHLNNIHSYLSPVLAQMASEYGAKVVWTLHDYKLVCPSYSCLIDGKVCEECFENPFAVVTKRCMKGSLPASLLAYAEARKWNKEKLTEWTDVFLCPSRFMSLKMEEGGFPPTKLYHLYNFISPEMMEFYSGSGVNVERQDYYCYVGRLSTEKGIRTLLKVASGLPYELRVAGTGPLEAELKKEFASCSNIKFLGHCSLEQVQHLFAKARFSVTPSECYENNPFSVIESLCGGTPFVGADIGGIPELANNKNGIIFTSGDIKSLELAIDEAWNREWDYASIQKNALEKFSPEQHYLALDKIYSV